MLEDAAAQGGAPEAAARQCLVVACGAMQHRGSSSPRLAQILQAVALEAVQAIASLLPGSQQAGEHEQSAPQFIRSMLDGLPSSVQSTLQCAVELKMPLN
jgi:hypothetical protein